MQVRANRIKATVFFGVMALGCGSSSDDKPVTKPDAGKPTATDSGAGRVPGRSWGGGWWQLIWRSSDARRRWPMISFTLSKAGSFDLLRVAGAGRAEAWRTALP